MMRLGRVVVVTIIASFVAPPHTAVAEAIAWLQQFGTEADDVTHDVTAMPDGSLRVVGRTSGVFEGFTSAGGEDVFVRGYRSDGTETWTAQFGTPGDDVATAVDADTNGALYLVGIVADALPGKISHGGYDAFVRKYRPDGSSGWTKQLGTAGYDVATDVAVHGKSLYVASLWGGRNSARLLKYSLKGSLRWSKNVPAGWHLPVATDASGIYVAATLEIAGSTEGENDLDVFVRKYDHRGIKLWTRRFGTTEIEQPLGMAAGEGALYLAGHTRGSLGAEPQGVADAFLRKYTAGGAKVWTRQWGTSSTDIAWSVDVSDSGDAYVAGSTAHDAFVSAMDSDGALLWTDTLSTNANEEARGVALVGGSVSVAGTTGGNLDGSHGAPTGADAFLARYATSA